jgi:pyrimidine deaminase RibD-like protein
MPSQRIDLPTFSVTGNTVTHENPKVITHGLMMFREAHIEVDTTKMSQEFLHRLMWHMGEGHIKVKVVNIREKSNG